MTKVPHFVIEDQNEVKHQSEDANRSQRMNTNSELPKTDIKGEEPDSFTDLLRNTPGLD